MAISDERLFELDRVPRVLEIPSYFEAEQRILAVLDLGNQSELQSGLEWYAIAHQICKEWADCYGLPSHSHVAGIIAALSPQRSWEENLVIARDLMEGRQIAHLKHAISSALSILSGEHPTDVLYLPHKNNPKVRAFYENINDPFGSQAVTIDRHALGVLIGSFRAIQQAGRYITTAENAWAQDVYRQVAAKLDVLPNQLQAATWLIWKRLRGDRITGVDPDQLFLEFGDTIIELATDEDTALSDVSLFRH